MGASSCVLLTVLALLAATQYADAAVCCTTLTTNGEGKCGDCTFGTPCCATGGCNIFCCNCAGSCRSGSCSRRRRAIDSMLLGDEQDDGALKIVAMADLDKDGRLSYQEAHDYLVRSPTGRSKRDVALGFESLDLNNDQYLTADEINPQQ